MIPAAAAPLLAGLPEAAEAPCSVGELTRRLKARLEESFPAVLVAGELSGVHRAASGHVYLTLKDDQAQLPAVLWRQTAAALPVELADGLQVVVRGEITVYAPRGAYQLIIRELWPQGRGALWLAFERLKAKLAAEGLFDPARKRPLPFLPRAVGVVTSPTGAVVHDILQVIGRRFPPCRIVLRPTPVQGAQAAPEIARAIADCNEYGQLDLLIVGRGGGSLEDLWAFNEEVVARAAAASRLPVISAVGHEVDVTILDFVADRRALTPSEAAELAVPRLDELLEQLAELGQRLARGARRRLLREAERLAALRRLLERSSPPARLRLLQQRLDEAGRRLAGAGARLARAPRERLARLAGRLEALSPLGVLARGYSLTCRENETAPLREAAALKPGDRVRTRLARGEFVAEVRPAAAREGETA